ncbi:DUF5987 family protein [Streptomyces sp. NPDC002952]|uniref:DUF5987 family protein n=1 Tax=Streptomyces sp. NPDC002952 TaxID=3364673 RepID=UPI0036AD2F6E
MTGPDRRDVLQALTGTLALLAVSGFPAKAATTDTATAALGSAEPWSTQTLLAFADTLVPGERRFPGDVVIAGAVTGPGAVQAGVLGLLGSPLLPLAPLLPSLASLLDARAVAYATLHLIWLPPDRPPFVGLSFRHRTALVGELFDEGGPDLPVWQVLALLVGLAFDTAAASDTAHAAAEGHPGLAWIGFPPPGPDGLWRFPDFTYGRALAALHPATTPSGSPA